MTTPILAITEIQAGQNQKEVPANAAFRALEAKIADVHTADFTSGDVTLTSAEWRDHGTVICTNVSVARALNTPLIKGFMFVDNSAGTAAVTVTRGSGTVEVPDGEGRIVYQDGTTNGIVNAGGGGAAGVGNLTGSAIKPHKGALVFLTSNEAISAATATRVPWDSAQYDTGFNGTPFWSAGSPTRLTIPAGVTKVRVTAQTFTDAAGNNNATIRFAAIRKNGNYGDTAQHEAGLGFVRVDDASFNDQLNPVSAVLEVSAGDYFELDYYSQEATDLGTVSGNEASWFAIEVIEDEETMGFFDRAKLLHVRDEQAATTQSGTFTSGSYQTRVLNTVKTNEIVGASLGSNQITLPAGRYYVEARAPALQVDTHKIKLRDTTGAADLIVGSPAFSDSTAGEASSDSVLRGQFVLTQTSVLELQHRCASTKSTNGLGPEPGTDFGVPAVFAEVYVWQMPELEAGVAIQGALIHVQDQKSDTTAGGTFTSGSFQTRDLNTVLTNEIAGASLGSNQITLPPGDYYIEATAPVFAISNHVLRLRDTTGTATLLAGPNSYADVTNLVNNRAVLSGRFSLATTSVLELQHQCAVTKATNGFGGNNSFGLGEVYSDLRIWKLKTIGSGPRSVSDFVPGTPATSAVVLQTVAERAFFMSDQLAGSHAFAQAAPSASTAFDVQVNGGSIGTITFAMSSQTATFVTSGSGNEFLVEGDVLTIVAPAGTLNGIADISFDLKAFFA